MLVLDSPLLNTISMMKVGWDLIHYREDLWVRIVRSKYGCGSDVIPKINSGREASNLWRGVCKGWEHIEKNISWRIGNGTSMKLWAEDWVPKEGPLTNVMTDPSLEIDVSCTVSNFLNAAGE